MFFNSLLETIEMHKVSLQDDESGLFLIMTSPGVVRLSVINKETSDSKLRACNTLSMTHVSIKQLSDFDVNFIQLCGSIVVGEPFEI